MDWNDEGIILSVRPYGEYDVIVELLTHAHGRHSGIVKYGKSRRMAPVLQPGNTIDACWRARLHEHLGFFRVEPGVSRAGRLMRNGTVLVCALTMFSHLRLLAEREPEPVVFNDLDALLRFMVDQEPLPILQTIAILGAFEVYLLRRLGFSLDVTCCALSGSTDDLVYLSPRTGRVASREAGEAWKDRLLKLPAFFLAYLQWLDSEDAQYHGAFASDSLALLAQVNVGDVVQTLSIGEHFLSVNAYGPAGWRCPAIRSQVIRALERERLVPGPGENSHVA